MFKPIDYSNQRYWEQAKRIKGSDVDSILSARGWVRTRFQAWTIYRRPPEEGDQVGVDIPNVVDEFYAARILEAAFLAALFEKRPVADVLDEWYEPQRMRDEIANRKNLRRFESLRSSRKVSSKNQTLQRRKDRGVLYAKIVPLRMERDGLRVKIIPLSEENGVIKDVCVQQGEGNCATLIGSNHFVVHKGKGNVKPGSGVVYKVRRNIKRVNSGT